MYAIRCGVQMRSSSSGTPAPSCSGCTVRPAPARPPHGDLGDRLVDRYAVALLAVAVAEGHRAGSDVVVPGDQHERHLLLLRRADLLLHPVVGRVDVDPDAGGAKAARNVLEVRHVLVGDRDADHLHRREPGRERAA
jgi:hypothetical protein